MSRKTVVPDRKSVICSAYSTDETEFMKELSDARPADLSKRNDITKKKLLKTALSGAIRYTAMLACFLVFIGASGYVASYAIQYMEKKQQNSFLHEDKSSAQEVQMSVKSALNKENAVLGQSMEEIDGNKFSLIEPVVYDEYFEPRYAEMIRRKRLYPDVWGWIDVPGTDVDYVVVQGETNNDYLYTDYDGKYTRYGSVFADYRNSGTILDNRNTILYGHNMNTANIMFAPLLKFVTDEKAFRNQTISIIMPDKQLYTYELFSVYDTYAWYNYIQTDFESDEEFLDFCERCREKSIFKKKIEFTKDSKLLTLSTCTVRHDGMRWAFHAVLVGISKY